VYSRWSIDWQKKAARLALTYVGVELGDVVDPRIITGMDSLSRDGELENFRALMQDLSMTQAIPEDVRIVFKMPEVVGYLAKQRGIDHQTLTNSTYF